MEYALPEATIGVKWQCVWNGNIHYNLLIITEFRKKILAKIYYI